MIALRKSLLPLPVGFDRRKLTSTYVLKILLAVTTFTTALSILRTWAGPFDSLASKAKQMIHKDPKPIDNTLPQGENKVFVTGLQFLGVQTSNNTCARRDLGFTGKLGDHWYAIHGDALWCSENITNPFAEEVGFRGMVRNTISLMTDNVLRPYDLYFDDTKPMPRPLQFFTFNETWGENVLTGFGGTSICETSHKTGIIYYAVNDFMKGVTGAGVAKVEQDDNLNVTVTERYGEDGLWWHSEDNPRYGDITAYRDERSDYIYLIGGAPRNAKTFHMMHNVYQARVRAADAFDFSKYEYWHGRQQGWKSEILKKFDSETAVMWNVGQGQIVWNDFLQCYVFAHTYPSSNQVMVRTADSPEGPWSDDLIVYATHVAKGTYEGGQIYAGVTHPYLDPTGRTLTITYTNHPNTIEAIKITFRKPLKTADPSELGREGI